jgi:hypothetical protein
LSFQRYKKLNVQVQEKNGETLLMEIAENVQRMLDRKMEAVKVSLKFASHVKGFVICGGCIQHKYFVDYMITYKDPCLIDTFCKFNSILCALKGCESYQILKFVVFWDVIQCSLLIID